MTRIVLSLTGILLPLFIYAGTLVNCPPPDCVAGFTVGVIPQLEGCGEYLFAVDLIDGVPSPECLEPISYAIYQESVASQPDFEPDASDVSVFITEDEGFTQEVRVYGIDANGDYAFCTVQLLVQQIIDCAPPPPSGISGVVTTEEGTPVPNVIMTYTGIDGLLPAVTNEVGYYEIELDDYVEDFSITPFKEEDNVYNGITALDMILIVQHILGMQALDSPYKMIAADVNNSGYISVLDIIHMRKLILGIDTELTNNSDWRFVDAAFAFSAPTNPWLTAFPELVNVNNPGVNEQFHDFIAIKIGDVNNSAVTN